MLKTLCHNWIIHDSKIDSNVKATPPAEAYSTINIRKDKSFELNTGVSKNGVWYFNPKLNILTLVVGQKVTKLKLTKVTDSRISFEISNGDISVGKGHLLRVE